MTYTTIGEALSVLPDNPHDTAAVLRDLGVKGRKESTTCCPLANYLKRSIDGCAEAWVGSWLATIDVNGQRVSWHVGPALSAFILNFDDGVYPELVEEAA